MPHPPMHCHSSPLLTVRWLALLVLAGAAQTSGAAPFLEAGRPTSAAHQAVAVLADASAEGLLPQDYNAQKLAQAVRDADQGAPLGAGTAEQLDAALTTALHRYLGDLHSGRIDPHQVHADFTVQPLKRFDPVTYLDTALDSPQFAQAMRSAAPLLPLYANLRNALAQYRGLVGHSAWANPPPALPQGKLALGQSWLGLAQLTERLVALGDLPDDTQPPPTYDSVLQDGVKAFQERHALAADGVLGKNTLAQLTVTPAERVQQIGLAMERLRWTPLQQAPRMIVVNIPEFVLRAYEWQNAKPFVQLTMNVIVGTSRDWRTPLFDEDMRFIEFSPYWNVPPSIARSETVPRLRRDPAYFQRQGFEFVGANGQVTTTLSNENLNAVLSGQLRIRQRPGPQNALGDIKFVLPNSNNIFLHHTPSPQMFERDRRDLSHGCVRVEEPVALAQFVLQDDPAWTPERIRKAMGQGKSSTIRLATPLPVLFAYSTTMVKNGKVHFFADIYGNDRLLEQALRQQPRLRQTAPQATPLNPR